MPKVVHFKSQVKQGDKRMQNYGERGIIQIFPMFHQPLCDVPLSWIHNLQVSIDVIYQCI